ncbi:MAG: hypothetical protein JXR84_18360 [Anaerolineae bacterium]|nr:hypothetical protein [Anaerolineae bacterium]
MKSRAHHYIVLQENLPAEEEQALGQAVADAMPPVATPAAFVEQLGRDLVAEARRHYDVTQRRHRVTRTVGLVGGGVLSVVGVVALWLFVQRKRTVSPGASPAASAYPAQA